MVATPVMVGWLTELLEKRKHCCANPFSVSWTPAHLADNLSDDEVTESFANQHGTTRLNILHNKIVDRASKQHAATQLDVSALEAENAEVQAYHQWLAQLSADLTAFKPDLPAPPELPTSVLTMAEPLSTFKYVLPRWPWDMVIEEFTRSPSLDFPEVPKLPKTISVAN